MGDLIHTVEIEDHVIRMFYFYMRWPTVFTTDTSLMRGSFNNIAKEFQERYVEQEKELGALRKNYLELVNLRRDYAKLRDQDRASPEIIAQLRVDLNRTRESRDVLGQTGAQLRVDIAKAREERDLLKARLDQAMVTIAELKAGPPK